MGQDRSSRPDFDKTPQAELYQKLQRESERVAKLQEHERRRYFELRAKQAEILARKEKAVQAIQREITAAIESVKNRPQLNLIPTGSLFSRQAAELQRELFRHGAELDNINVSQAAERIKFLEKAEREYAERASLEKGRTTEQDKKLSPTFNRASRRSRPRGFGIRRDD